MRRKYHSFKDPNKEKLEISKVLELAEKNIQDVAPEYVAKNTFDSLYLVAQLKQNIQKRGFTTLTPVQDRVIPNALQGKDVVGIASTGTGKTGAFVIPLINKLHSNQDITALILTPTRELAFQIDEVVKSLSEGLNVNTVMCIGGVNMTKQKRILYKLPNFIIGTPGRIKDLINKRAINTNLIRALVLDEVDKMFAMGFLDEIDFIIKKLPRNRQTLFFSATLDPKIEEIMHNYIKSPIITKINANKALGKIKYDFVYYKSQKQKLKILETLLIDPYFTKVLIFCNTKRAVDALETQLKEKEFKVAAIHGDFSQGSRLKSFKEFREEKVQALIATDVAARGLDIQDVSHVINYDMPELMEEFIHRVGRTGRASKEGHAMNFINTKYIDKS